MQLSVDLVLIVINLLALAYSYGRFSEKIGSLEVRILEILTTLNKMNSDFYSAKDGVKNEVGLSALWAKFDGLPCKDCNLLVKKEHEK